MSDGPTFDDVFPDPENMPEDLKRMFIEGAEENDRKLAAIEANPKHSSKSWYQVEKTGQGVVTKVWANKPVGKAVGLWMFGRTIDDDGHPILKVNRNRHLGENEAAYVCGWIIDDTAHDFLLMYALAELVGLRTARAVVTRLRPGSDVSVAAETRHAARNRPAREDS